MGRALQLARKKVTALSPLQTPELVLVGTHVVQAPDIYYRMLEAPTFCSTVANVERSTYRVLEL